MPDMAAPTQLICPECGGPLREVWTEANYGRVLVLDQCERCGGVWFDRWELHFATDEAIKGLGEVDAASFAAPVEAHPEKGLCPRCSGEFAVFTDPNLPKDALIERCPGCSGLWLNRGELGRYASHRESTRGGRSAPRTAGLETLRHLQKELRVGEMAVPTTAQLASNLQDEPPLESREVAKDLAFLALQSLMRLVFKI